MSAAQLSRRQCLQEYKDDLEQQLQNERQLAMEEKERMMECMWAEKQALLRAMAGLRCLCPSLACFPFATGSHCSIR